MLHRFITQDLQRDEAAMSASVARRVAFAAQHDYFGGTRDEAIRAAEREVCEEAESELANLRFSQGLGDVLSVTASELACMSTDGRL